MSVVLESVVHEGNVTEAVAKVHDFNYYMVDFWNEVGDPRSLQYPLMGSMRPLLAVLGLYLFFVFFFGPWFMRHRKPYTLKPILIVYNLTMSVVNAYFHYLVISKGNVLSEWFDFKFRPTTDMSEEAHQMAWFAYMYCITKYIDLFDTVFFILRKKDSQITALHLYHHTMVAFMGWVYFRMNSSFIVTTYHFGTWNTLVHAIMYAYYGLAALGPAMQPYLWWKRYLTQLQIVQFVSMFFHAVLFCIYQEGYHTFFLVDVVWQTTFYLVMFSRFYLNTYNASKKAKKVKCDANNNDNSTLNGNTDKRQSIKTE